MMSRLNVIAKSGKQEIIMTREFSAPRDLVFKTMSDPALIPQWWGPHGLTTEVDQMDVRMGGIWRYVQRDSEGKEYAFRGVYHEIRAPERMVYTFEWEGLPGHILLETVTLEEQDGKTLITDASVFQSLEDRDGMVQSGMEEGAADTWDRLEALLNELQAKEQDDEQA
jgi:uncharacterized protein YndB with AHSA1/START domain